MTTVFDDQKQDAQLLELRREEEENLVKLLSDKYNLPYIDLRGLAPEPDAMQYLLEEDARGAGVVPFKLVGKKLYLATLSPGNDKLEQLLRPIEDRGTELLLFLCSHASLEHVLARYKEFSRGTKVESGMFELVDTLPQEAVMFFLDLALLLCAAASPISARSRASPRLQTAATRS